MTRPPWEVADVIQRGGSRFLDRYQNALTWPQVKVLNAIERCRTAALGGHRDQCDGCGHRTISYNSCLMESNSLWRVESVKRACCTRRHALDSPLRPAFQKRE
jgi:hypothetical protein